MSRILIVDDEDKIRELIRLNLELAGYECFEAKDGNDAIEVFSRCKPDLVLLDIMLPEKDGYEIAEQFIKFNVGIIFLTAKDSIPDKIKGLKIGADDYIVKPFESMELIARIEAVLRRCGKKSNEFEYQGVKIDFDKRIVFVNGSMVELTAQEFELLETLVKNKNFALSREKLLEIAWGCDYYGDTRTVDMHIQKLRKKLNWENVIITVYKYGYRLNVY